MLESVKDIARTIKARLRACLPAEDTSDVSSVVMSPPSPVGVFDLLLDKSGNFHLLFRLMNAALKTARGTNPTPLHTDVSSNEMKPMIAHFLALTAENCSISESYDLGIFYAPCPSTIFMSRMLLC